MVWCICKWCRLLKLVRRVGAVWSVAVCCIVLQCVAVRCVLQCVVVCSRVLLERSSEGVVHMQVLLSAELVRRAGVVYRVAKTHRIP